MKILKYLIYHIITIALLLGYWGFVQVYYSHFPIYNFKILDYISAVGIFFVIYILIDKIRTELTKYLKL
jgi:hypothetical protein